MLQMLVVRTWCLYGHFSLLLTTTKNKRETKYNNCYYKNIHSSEDMRTHSRWLKNVHIDRSQQGTEPTEIADRTTFRKIIVELRDDPEGTTCKTVQHLGGRITE